MRPHARRSLRNSRPGTRAATSTSPSRKPTLTFTLTLSLRYACRYVDWPPTSSDSSVSGSSPEGIALELAPMATSSTERTEVVATLVEELVADGHIPAAKVSETDCICSHLFASVRSCSQLFAAVRSCVQLLEPECSCICVHLFAPDDIP